MKAPRLELITWRDHWSSDGGDWVNLDEETEAGMAPLVCRSVGWVLSEDRRMVKLVSHLDGKPDEAENGFGIMNILKSDIVSRRRLGDPAA